MIVRAVDLHKQFRLYKRPADRLWELLGGGCRHRVYQALAGVDFALAPGETLGVIGPNGAGKSTLLKLLTGVLLPDRGRIEVTGRVTGLLELGTGFDMAQSGWANIAINGLLLGMTPAEIQRRREAIVEFAELGGYIQEPLRTYSSGMVMRLGFAVAIHAEPQCFLVDEALAVGDAHFQQKCLRRLKQFRAAGGAVILVSHDLNAVKLLCDRALLLCDGKVRAQGDPEVVVNDYNALVAELNDQEGQMLTQAESRGYGTLTVAITAVAVVGERSGAAVVGAGEITTIAVTVAAQGAVDDVVVGMLIRDRFGQDVFGINSYHLGQPIALAAGQVLTAHFSLAMDLGPGKYTLTAAVHRGENHVDHCYHWQDHAATFEVVGYSGPVFAGLCRLHPTLTLTPSAPGAGTTPDPARLSPCPG
ncbi:MAG: ABC transporter ATP-binding protein [Candidatus Competibacterales bacterium]